MRSRHQDKKPPNISKKKHIDLGETAVEERKKDRITPSESLKKSRPTAKNNKIKATEAENIITVWNAAIITEILCNNLPQKIW